MKRCVRRIVSRRHTVSLPRPGRNAESGSEQRPPRSSGAAAFACRVDPRFRSMRPAVCSIQRSAAKACALHNPTDAANKRGTWKSSEVGDRYRRGLYVQYQRMSPYPQLVEFRYAQRLWSRLPPQRSNTALQSLNLLNDRSSSRRPRRWRPASWRSPPADFGRASGRLFRLCLARPPDSLESDSLLASLERQKQILRSNPSPPRSCLPIEQPGIDRLEAAAWVGICSVAAES